MSELKKLIATAENGDPVAQHDIGINYYYGYGVSQDYDEAIKWCRKAADQGHFKGREGNLLAEKMPPTQIAEAQKAAREWLLTK